MAYTYGDKSKKVFNTLHSDLQIILDWGIKMCIVDYSLNEGHRTLEKQFEYFKKGRKLINGEWVVVSPKQKITNADGVKIKGKHNYNPSLAVDFSVYVPDKPQLEWDAVHLTYVAASLIMIAEFLFKEGIIQHKLRWGGNWDMDGDLSDNKLCDRPHLELYKP